MPGWMCNCGASACVWHSDQEAAPGHEEVNVDRKRPQNRGRRPVCVFSEVVIARDVEDTQQQL